MPDRRTAQRGAESQERRGEDRRLVHPLFADWRWALHGRRHGGRRTDEGPVVVADRYHPRVVAVTVLILLLSGLDATLTLFLLRSGVAVEANPVMRVLIEHDTQLFVNLKTVFTAASLVFLVVLYHSRIWGRIPVRWLLHGLLAVYVLLIGYELSLIWRAFG